MPDSRLMEVMLLNYETTNRIDYRDGEIKPIVRTVYKEKPGCLRIRPEPLKDIHTHSVWKNPVPFNLFIKPKEIVRTNPNQIQEKYVTPEDLRRVKAQKTRPRLVMTPAISLDNIIDDQTRNMLIKDVYKTTAQIAYSDIAPMNSSLKAPFPGLPGPANPITLELLQVPYVSPEWRMESAGWDRARLRAHCDPSKEFFLTRNINCNACKVTSAVEAQRRLMREMKKH